MTFNEEGKTEKKEGIDFNLGKGAPIRLKRR